MTLKELLDEQEKKLLLGKQYLINDGVFIDRKHATDFLRQNTIDTVKWVMGVIEVKRRKLVTQPAKYKGSDANVWREGKNTTIDDILSELNKSIEDHERKS